MFGAILNGYGHRKTGRSIYANPEYEQKELHKTLKWAIAASQELEPFCAVLIYPRWRLEKFMELLTHHNVRLIAKFTRGSFSFMAPDHWATGDGDEEGRNTANWQVMLIEVSNAAGRRPPQEGGHKHVDAEKWMVEAARADGAVLSVHSDPAFNNTEEPYVIKHPEGYTAAETKGYAVPLPRPKEEQRGTELRLQGVSPEDA